jgi:hypothetical protein
MLPCALLPLLLPSAPAPSAQRPSPSTAPWVPPPAAARPRPPPPCHGKRGTVSHRPQTRFRSGTPTSPYTYVLAPDTNPKILFIPFLRPGENPVENTPPVFFFPKNFKTKNSAWERAAFG